MSVLLFMLMMLALPLAGGELVLPSGTPVFDRAHAEAVPVDIWQESRTVQTVGDPVRVWFRFHPLARYADYYKTEIPGQGARFVSPDLQVDPVTGEVRWMKEAHPAGKVLLPAALGILLFLCYRLYRFPKDRGNPWIYIGLVIAARTALLSYMLCMAGAIVCNPADEPGYFAVGYDLLQGKCSGPWTYPVGHGVLMMIPWILCTGAESYFDIAVGISWFSAFVLGNAALLLGFRILQALKVPVKTAFAAVLAWAVLPFVLHHVPDWQTLTFENFAGWPSFRAGFRFYMELIGCGFNGMSDMFSTALLFGVMLLALRMPLRTCFLILVSLLFGAVCLVRLNNVFFAPVLAFILTERFMPRFRAPWFIVQFLVAGCVSYLFAVGVQFAVNYYQFGDMWTFPYSLHALDRAAGDRPADGFTLATLFKGTNLRYLLESNIYVMSAGIAGLIVLRDRRQRAILGLWALPVILFFCGYSHTFCDAVRFILSAYIPLLAAAALALVQPWKGEWRRLAVWGATALLLVLLHNGWVIFVMLVLLLARSVVDALQALREARKPGTADIDPLEFI